MISFFRVNDPFRLVFILVILTLIRLPVFLGDMPLILSEVEWMVAGEKLASGALLYVDLWDDQAPFAAFVYWIIHELFGRSPFSYHIISLILVFVQSILLSNILTNTKAFNENTFVPALIYILLMSLFVDFNTLSPVLMAVTFMLFAIRNIFYHIDNQSWVGNLLNTGLLISVASLFYFPCILLIFPVILSYTLFTGTAIRRYFLFLYGVLLPYLLVGMFFYWFDALDDFYERFIYVNIFNSGRTLMGWTDFLIIATLPAIYLAFAFFKIFETNLYSGIQVRYQQAMFFMMVAAAVSWVLVNRRVPHQMIILAPFAAFFLSHYFLLMQRRIFAEVFFILFIAYVFTMNLGSIYHKIVPDYVHYDSLLVAETPLDELVSGKKILVLGNNLHYYKNASLATPYLNWNMAMHHFENPLYYDNLSTIFSNFKKDLPEVIIDEKGVFKAVARAMPSLQNKYEEVEPNIFILTEDQK